MANSLSFGGTDLSTYGLLLLSRDIPVRQEAATIQLPDRAYADRSKILPTSISLAVQILGDDASELKTKVDAVKKVLGIQVDGELILDVLSDRYWLARFESLAGSYKHRVFSGSLNFVCYDPHAYSTSETSSGPHTVDEDPETIVEEPGGTAKIEPVYTLTADDTLTGTTVGIKNNDTGYEIEWTGNLVPTDVLIIDCQRWLVLLNGVASMATVTGQFPNLLPDQENELEVKGFSGTVTITYRDRYA